MISATGCCSVFCGSAISVSPMSALAVGAAVFLHIAGTVFFPLLQPFFAALAADAQQYLSDACLVGSPFVGQQRNPFPLEFLVPEHCQIIITEGISQQGKRELCGAAAAISPIEAGRRVVIEVEPQR